MPIARLRRPLLSRQFDISQANGLGAKFQENGNLNPLTLACWWYGLDTGADHIPLSLGDESQDARYVILQCRGDGTIRAAARRTTTRQVDATTSWEVGKWVHIAGTFRSMEYIEVWVNGISEGTITGSAITFPNTMDTFGVGLLWRPSELHATGVVGAPAVYKEELSAGDIMKLAKGTPPEEVRPEALLYAPDLETLVVRRQPGLGVGFPDGPHPGLDTLTLSHPFVGANRKSQAGIAPPVRPAPRARDLMYGIPGVAPQPGYEPQMII